MSDSERIKRLETVLGTLITWLLRELGEVAVKNLLGRLESDDGHFRG